MRGIRALALVLFVSGTAAGGSLVTAALLGMKASEIAHLAAMLGPAVLATVASAAAARRILANSPVRHRLFSLALVAVVVSLANLAVLASLMMLRHETLLVATLVVYSAGSGAGAAWSLSRSFSRSIEQLTSAAATLGSGDLSARIGNVEGGPELQALAHSLDAMAARLEQSITAEQNAIRVRDDLITAVSHDLRTPLAGLRAMVEAIGDGVVDDPDTIARYIREMRDAVGAVTLLVDDLFELVRLDPREVQEETRRATLAEVVARARAACESQARAKGLVVETVLDGAEEGMCSPRLARVVQNLIQNAIRHTPSDGTVRVGARRVPGALQVWVEDTGVGIDEESAVKVFDPFWRGDAARSTAGFGLGLALAKRIVEALGGEIGVSANTPVGARFSLVVPEAN